MDMNKYAGSESKYLKAADLQGKSIRVRISGVELVEFEDDDGNKTTKPAISLAGKQKKVVANPTTVMELGEAYGFESDGWIGKEIGLSTKHYKSLGVDGIVIAAIREFEEIEDNSLPF